MKIKASVQKLNKKVLFAVFAVVGIALTAVRFYQMFSLTDPATGFFTDRGNITVMLYYILWGVTFLGAMLLFFLSADCATGACGKQKNLPHACTSLLFAAAAVFDTTAKLKELMNSAGAVGLMNYVKAEKQYIALIGIVFGFLTTAVLMADAAAFFSGSGFFKQLKLCHLFPVLWLFCITVNYFSVTVSYLNVTQLMLMIFADGFLMVFLFEYGRFLCDINADEAPWMLFASGTIAEIFLCAEALPNLVLTLAGKTEMLVQYCPLRWYELAGALFIASALFLAAGNKNHVAIHLEPVGASGENEAEE